MIATAFPDATDAGVSLLKKGGNAVDAACAAALALGVCEPQASGLGGQTMMLLTTESGVVAVDGSSRAPTLAHVGAVYPSDRAAGYRATTVPSTLATLWYVHTHYGNLPWKAIIAPAIRIAEDGYEITRLQHQLQERELEAFQSVPSRSGERYFLHEGAPYSPGELFRQPDLAALLRVIARTGAEDFYHGTTARRIDADMRKNGGLLRYDDIALIPWPILRKPLHRTFRGLTVYTMPPPGAGRSLLFTLMMINAIRPRHLNRDATERAVLLTEVFRRAILERADRPFDPNFYPQMAKTDILNRSFVSHSIHDIMRETAICLPIRETVDERLGETTHLSVIDEGGMAVSLSQSIELVYGSKAAAEGLGFLYNNYMLAYEYGQISHPYYLRPNTVPWGSVAPSLIFNGHDILMAVGSPGSERIFSSIAQFLIHIFDERMSIGEAMEAPRLHCSLGGRVSLEADRFPPAIVEALRKNDYRIDPRSAFSFYLGAIHAVLRKSDGSGFQGVAEIRRDGTAGGY